MPVVRNPQYYFKEGFCWSDINTTFLKCRKKEKSVNDVKSMSLYSITDIIPEFYLICLINSNFISLYVDYFINNTQTFQINDARQLPIIVPTKEQLLECNEIFTKVIKIKKREFNDNLTKSIEKRNLENFEKYLSDFIENLYCSV